MKKDDLQVCRHELKYYINYSDYEYLKAVLRIFMDRDSYQKNDEGYFIRSVYLDDIFDSSVEEKLAGVEKRDKYRLRIYDCNQDWVKFERKRKYGNYVKKTTGIITRKEAEGILRGDYSSLLKYNNKNLNSIYFDLKRKYFHPVVTVDYIRDAFVLDYNDIRITFDKCLRGNREDFSLFDKDFFTQKLQRDEIIIMEIKFNNCLPSWFNKLFIFNTAVSSAISKYCQSRLGYEEYHLT